MDWSVISTAQKTLDETGQLNMEEFADKLSKVTQIMSKQHIKEHFISMFVWHGDKYEYVPEKDIIREKLVKIS